jgi:hypothetical protein
MGTCTSKRENEVQDVQELNTLSQQIEELKADYKRLLEDSRNRERAPNTTVSKEDFETWKHDQQIRFNELEEMVEKKAAMKYSKLMTEKDTQIADLTKQVDSLQNANATLEGKILHIASSQTIPEQLKLRELSRAKVDEFVEKLLQDDSVNISYLPDWVERKLYKNILNLILGLLDNTFNTTSIKLLGHLLTFNIVPDQSQTREININQIDQEDKEKEESNITVSAEEHIFDDEIEDYVDDLIEKQ